MITREQLKVGEIYEHDIVKKISRVLFIGDELLVTCDNDEQENHYTIDGFLAHWSIILKPKRMIKLIGYMTKDGLFIEYLHGATMPDSYEKVSERTIEVQDDL